MQRISDIYYPLGMVSMFFLLGVLDRAIGLGLPYMVFNLFWWVGLIGVLIVWLILAYGASLDENTCSEGPHDSE
jgi:hypothetical protein